MMLPPVQEIPRSSPHRQAAAMKIRLANAATPMFAVTIGRSPAGIGSAGQLVGTARSSAPARAGRLTHSGNSAS